MPLLDAQGLTVEDVTFADLETLAGALDARGRKGRVGIAVTCDVDGDTLAREAAQADAIAISVPATGDGRVFSLAATLRERGYRGVIRAVGPMIPDQFAFALACGVDQIEIADEQLARQPLDQWLAAKQSISRTYVGAEGIFARRGEA